MSEWENVVVEQSAGERSFHATGVNHCIQLTKKSIRIQMCCEKIFFPLTDSSSGQGKAKKNPTFLFKKEG